jgi:hypothetical protein
MPFPFRARRPELHGAGVRDPAPRRRSALSGHDRRARRGARLFLPRAAPCGRGSRRTARTARAPPAALRDPATALIVGLGMSLLAVVLRPPRDRPHPPPRAARPSRSSAGAAARSAWCRAKTSSRATSFVPPLPLWLGAFGVDASTAPVLHVVPQRPSAAGARCPTPGPWMEASGSTPRPVDACSSFCRR